MDTTFVSVFSGIGWAMQLPCPLPNGLDNESPERRDETI